MKFTAILLCATMRVCSAQEGGTIYGQYPGQSGYQPVAPGQIVTFVVSKIGAYIDKPVRIGATILLPFEIYGVSGTIDTKSVPIVAVEPMGNCLGFLRPECEPTVAITVQIPFELRADNPFNKFPSRGSMTTLQLVDAAGANASTRILVLFDQVHLLRGCDSSFRPSCDDTPIAYHRDGRRIREVEPAEVGEEIVVYAYGLGYSDPLIPTATVPRKPVELYQPIGLSFSWGANAVGARPLIRFWGEPVPVIPAESARLTTQFPGLYQVNVKVPMYPPGTPACSVQSDPVERIRTTANLAISIGGATSFDSVGICVRIPVE